MSGAPKRPHEEGGHSSSKYPHEESGSHSRHPSTEYHPPYEMTQDNRISKIARTESRDMDRRSPLHSMYRMPLSSSNDSHSDHPARSDNKLELKDPKDNREVKGDSRDSKTEKRELFGEAKKDSQSAKGEKDTKHNETKDMRHDKESFYDSKGGPKIEKDGYGGAASHSSWKETKDYHRGKGSFEGTGGNVDSWHIPRINPQGPVELGKDGSSTDGRDHVEVHEAVGENRVDSKSEDRHKDKDRKRQDTKHRDWTEKEKERAERKVSLHVGMSSGDWKDSAKEEEVEKWKRDRKDFSGDKERPKEREKEQVKRDPWSGMEKQNLPNENDARDASSTKMSEQENLVSEQKKQKESDGSDNGDREGRDRKKERVTDVEGDRSGKRNKPYEKEPEDGGVDGDKEREREAFGYGIQQKRRMLRPRSSPQRATREPRFRACSAEIEGPQGKTDDSAVVYKVGECMRDLIKLWKEHECSQTDKSAESSQNGPTLEIRIPAEHVTATNRQVRGGQLWGTDVYTYDSDLVAVLMHTGYCRPTASPPPPAIQELRVTIRVLPPQDCYISTLRNNVRSRAWGSAIGCSYRVEGCCIVKKEGGTINLEPCLAHASTVEPTIAPVAVERTMTTRAAASNALRQQRFLREVTIQYNLCNEPWIKYSLNVVADKGLKRPLYTAARLKKGEVLYLETHTTRYELCFTGEKAMKAASTSFVHDGEVEKSQNHHSSSTNGDRIDSDNMVVDVFRWSRCKRPLPQNVMRSIGIPLPLEHVQVLEDNLEWEDVQWSQTGVWINGKEYPLARVHFLAAE